MKAIKSLITEGNSGITGTFHTEVKLTVVSVSWNDPSSSAIKLKYQTKKILVLSMKNKTQLKD